MSEDSYVPARYIFKSCHQPRCDRCDKFLNLVPYYEDIDKGTEVWLCIKCNLYWPTEIDHMARIILRAIQENYHKNNPSD